MKMRFGLKSFLDELSHFLVKLRVVPTCCTIFVCWLTYDFHVFYINNALHMSEWQMVGVGAYAGAFVTTLKFMFDHLLTKAERDDC